MTKYYTKSPKPNTPKRYIIGSTAEYYQWLEEVINLINKDYGKREKMRTI